MKKQLNKLIIAILIIFSFIKVQSAGDSSELLLNCEHAVLIDATSGNIIYQKNATGKAYPASTTKILTTALAIESGAMEGMATISAYAENAIGINGSNAGLLTGEKIAVEDLINMALILSANDAANAIAETVSGSVESFVSLMNQKCESLGLTDTCFSNPIGLDVEDGYPDHMTTALDLAYIMRYATSLKEFREVIGLARYQMPETNLNNGYRPVFDNTNLLITSNYYKTDEYAIVGGKTGYTKAAKNVLVVCARNTQGKELIAVLMENPDRFRMFEDAKKLFDYGFNKVNFDSELVQKGFYDVRYRGTGDIIDDFYQAGYLTGSEDGAFGYDENADKEMFIEALLKIKGIKVDEYQQDYIEYAIEDGLIDSSWATNKNMPITKTEVIQVFGKVLDNNFTSVAQLVYLSSSLENFNGLNSELKMPILKLCRNGIIPWGDIGSISVDGTMTREELVLILNNYANTLKDAKE